MNNGVDNAKGGTAVPGGSREEMSARRGGLGGVLGTHLVDPNPSRSL